MGRAAFGAIEETQASAAVSLVRCDTNMPATVKLLGPDLGNPLLVEVEASDNIAGLKQRALEKWPAGARVPPVWCARARPDPPTPASSAGMDVPDKQQLRIIYQGRFMADNQPLKGVGERVARAWLEARLLLAASSTVAVSARVPADCKVTDGDTTAMHLIIKSLTAKPESAARRAAGSVSAREPAARPRRVSPCACTDAPSGSDDKAPKCSCVIC